MISYINYILSPKIKNNEKQVHKLIGNYGSGLFNEHCQEWIKIFESKMIRTDQTNP